MGKMMSNVKRDIERITSNTGEWAQEMTFEAPAGDICTVMGLHSKIHLGVQDEMQKWANVKHAHCSVSEKQFTEAGYPVRNAAGEVTLFRHKVTTKDSNGNDKTYQVDQCWPNETIGLITVTLGDYEP